MKDIIEATRTITDSRLYGVTRNNLVIDIVGAVDFKTRARLTSINRDTSWPGHQIITLHTTWQELRGIV